MKTLRYLALLGLIATAPAFAGTETPECSPRMLAGRWMFATDVGKQSFFPGGDITAIGTFWIDRFGAVSRGVFDATVADWGFLPGIKFTGSFALNADCTGTFTFTTSAGTTRTDSVIVLGPGHIRGMSQDVQFLWTYDMRRL
jgi:hypothetical protein